MKVNSDRNWRALSALGAVAFPFTGLKLGYVLSRSGIDLGLPLGLVLGLGIGGLCALNVPNNKSVRYIALAIYIPVVLVLIFIFAFTFDRYL